MVKEFVVKTVRRRKSSLIEPGLTISSSRGGGNRGLEGRSSFVNGCWKKDGVWCFALLNTFGQRSGVVKGHSGRSINTCTCYSRKLPDIIFVFPSLG